MGYLLASKRSLSRAFLFFPKLTDSSSSNDPVTGYELLTFSFSNGERRLLIGMTALTQEMLRPAYLWQEDGEAIA